MNAPMANTSFQGFLFLKVRSCAMAGSHAMHDTRPAKADAECSLCLTWTNGCVDQAAPGADAKGKATTATWKKRYHRIGFNVAGIPVVSRQLV
jgi:hypothetical protein